MRYVISITLASVIMLVGCHSPSLIHTQTAAPIPFHSMFITTFGTHTSQDGKWQIKASSDSLVLSRPSVTHSADWITNSPHDWKAQAGWFVYTETVSKVWAYDGDRRLILLQLTGVEDYSQMFEMLFPCAVPSEVSSRLSEDAQQTIKFLKDRPSQ
jgi:hypothetical protein